jgi:predicted aspartyl protease
VINWFSLSAKMRHSIALFGLMIFYSSSPLHAQSAIIPQTNVSEPIATETITETAIELDEAAVIRMIEFDLSNRMTVAVQVNNSAPVPFIVDTGSERTVISNELARHLGLKSGPQLNLATLAGPARVPSFLIDSLSTLSTKTESVQAPGLLHYNIGAFGILGIDSLEGRKVLLDFKKNSMQVLPSTKRRGRATEENGMLIVQAQRRAGRMILSSAQIGNDRVDIILDTGAQNSIGNAALRRRLRASDRSIAYQDVQLRSVTGAVISGEMTQIKEINIGGFSINDMPIVFSDNYVFGALGLEKRPAMLLGMDTLKLFDRVMVDFSNRRVGFDLPR